MFTQSVFIRKNNAKLKRKLKEIGYDVDELSLTSECIATAATIKKAVGISQKSFDDPNPYRTWNCADRIDCGDNEELFLAIAALNDENDKFQYFVLESNIGSINFPESIIHKGSLIQSLTNKWFIDINEDGTPNELSSRNWPSHKANVKELIEYFKK